MYGGAGQLRLIAGLRWRIFVNSLRTGRGKVDLAGRVFFGLTIAGGVLGLGVVLGAASWEAFHSGHPEILAGGLWFIFLVWQFLPIFVTGFGAQADMGLLLRFPLPYSGFVLLTLAYGLLDPVSIAALYWLVMILAGIAIAAPGLLLWAIAALAAFAAVNLLLSRAVFAWLDRWLAQRRTREILGIVFFLLLMSLQFIQPISERWGKQATLEIHRFAPVESVFPPGMAASAIEGAQLGQDGLALMALGSLAVLGLAFAWVLNIRLRAQYRGEQLSEAPREKVAATRKTVHKGWRLAGLSPPVAALLEKDLRYLVRNTAQYLTLAVPLILVFVFGLQGGGSGEGPAMPLASSSFFFPAAVAYCMLIVLGPAFNALGFDGPGVAMLFAAPVRFRDVMIAKNVLYTLVLVLEIAAVFVGISFVRGGVDPAIAAVTLSAVFFALPLNFAVGNLVSLHFPRRLQFGSIRRQRASGMAVLLTFSTQLAIMGFSVGIYLLSHWAGGMWMAGMVFLALAVLALIVYRQAVEASSGIAERHREALVTELCHPAQ
ncbi:MAG: hypothetical protein P8Z30_08930 [Acidobacteriota bacterium]